MGFIRTAPRATRDLVLIPRLATETICIILVTGSQYCSQPRPTFPLNFHNLGTKENSLFKKQQTNQQAEAAFRQATVSDTG